MARALLRRPARTAARRCGELVHVIEPGKVVGGVACSFECTFDDSLRASVNYGVQGGNHQAHANTIEMMRVLGMEVGDAELTVSFGKGVSSAISTIEPGSDADAVHGTARKLADALGWLLLAAGTPARPALRMAVPPTIGGLSQWQPLAPRDSLSSKPVPFLVAALRRDEHALTLLAVLSSAQRHPMPRLGRSRRCHHLLLASLTRLASSSFVPVPASRCSPAAAGARLLRGAE
jgi:hypothetical protein